MDTCRTGVDDEFWMLRALQEAESGRAGGEVPVGAVVVSAEGELIGAGHNAPISECDPTCHAEIVSLRAACRANGNYRLPGATLYVTIEPCTMCVGAMVHARIERLVFGATEPKAGASALLASGAFNHHITVTCGVLAAECARLLAEFFQERRKRA